MRNLVTFIQFKKPEKRLWSGNTPRWVFFTFLKLYKWQQIPQRVTYCEKKLCTNLFTMLQKVPWNPYTGHTNIFWRITKKPEKVFGLHFSCIFNGKLRHGTKVFKMFSNLFSAYVKTIRQLKTVTLYKNLTKIILRMTFIKVHW